MRKRQPLAKGNSAKKNDQVNLSKLNIFLSCELI